MPSKVKIAARLLVVSLQLVAIPSFAAVGGQIVDEAGKPVAGAFIVTTWRGTTPMPNPLESRITGCYSILATQTASDGTFKLRTGSPEGGSGFVGREVSSFVYVPGYRFDLIQRTGRPTEIKRSKVTAAGRASELVRVVDSTCITRRRVRELVQIFKALHDEAVALGPAKDRDIANAVATLGAYHAAASAGVWPPEAKHWVAQ